MRTSGGGLYLVAAAAAEIAFASGCGLSLSGDGASYTLGGSAAGAADAGGSVSISGGGPGSSAALDAGVSASDTGPSSTVSPPDAGLLDSASALPAPDAGPDAGDDASVPPVPPAPPVSLPPLLGAWSFDEGAGTQSADLSGNGHPMSLVGGASWAAGKEGSGLALDGVTGSAGADVTIVDTTKSFSVTSWVKLAVVDSWQMAVTEGDVNGSLFGLKLRGDGTNTFDFDIETSDDLDPGYVVARSIQTAQATVWVHLAGVYDASARGSLKAYVNGALESSVVVGQPLVAASGNFVLGCGLYNDVWGAFLQGTLDEVEVFDGALTDAQVASVYATQE